MFFEARVNGLNANKLLYWHGQDQEGKQVNVNGVFNFPPEWLQAVQAAILSGEIRNSTFYGQCPAQACPVMHLKIPGCGGVLTTSSISECRCSNIVGDENRQHLLTIRKQVEKLAEDRFNELLPTRDQITVTFACSGTLLAELALITKLLKLIQENKQEHFILNINFIDPQYTDYINLYSWEKKSKTLMYDSVEMSRRTQQELTTSLHSFSQKDANNNLIKADSLKHFAAINPTLAIIQHLLQQTPRIRVKARFFSNMNDYGLACKRDNQLHDLLVGQDIAAVWDPLRFLHQGAGKAGSFAVAWSKRMVDQQAVALELKQMLREEENWSTTETPLELIAQPSQSTSNPAASG